MRDKESTRQKILQAGKEALFCAIVQPVADGFLKLQAEGHITYSSMSEDELQNNKNVSLSGADHVIVLKDGELAEEGTPSELMRQNGLFTRLNLLQNESAVWAI